MEKIGKMGKITGMREGLITKKNEEKVSGIERKAIAILIATNK